MKDVDCTEPCWSRAIGLGREDIVIGAKMRGRLSIM